MPGPVFNAFAAAFGATLALVICAGAIFLRSQKAKLRHSLMLAAMEKGITSMPGAAPLWLASLRQGVSIVVIGVTLMLAGIATVGKADQVPMPAAAMLIPPPPPPPAAQDAAPASAAAGAPVPLLPGISPDGRPRPTPPPPEAPAVHAWHVAQDQKHLGLIGLFCGVLLSALGAVRVIFAWVERKYTRAAGLPV